MPPSGETQIMMKRNKISIIGCGTVGATCAYRAAALELGDIVMVETPEKEGVAKGKALDLQASGTIRRFDSKLIGTSEYADIANSDVVIITAGLPRKPGMSRDDLIEVNGKIIIDISHKVKRYAPNAIVIVVTNPLDAMVYACWKATGFPTNRIMGQAGVLDTARYRAFIAMEIGCSIEDVQALLLGGHGDDMVPLARYTSVHGIPVQQLLPDAKIEACVERAKVGGAEIVNLMGASAYYAPAAGTVQMAEAIIRDKKRILPCAAYCEQKYDVGGYFVGVPALLGGGGVEKIVEIDLNEEEWQLMRQSIDSVKTLSQKVDELFPGLNT
jgi:malate dehydrogenase